MTIEVNSLGDSTLPHLRTALNTSMMQKVFQKKLLIEEKNLHIQECTIESTRYRPQRNCMVCYRLMILDNETKEVCNQTVSTVVYSKGESFSRFAKAQSNKLIIPKFGTPLTHIPDLDMVAWTFPNDRKLDCLEKLTRPSYLKQDILPKIVASSFSTDWEITKIASEVVQYVPEHSCNIRVHLHIYNAKKNDNKNITLYGKTYADDNGAESYQTMTHLWDSKARRTGQLKMAQPLGYFSDSKTLWQLGLSGATLLDFGISSPQFLSLIEEGASTVGALHNSPLACSQSIQVTDLLVKLEEVKRVLLRCRPSCKKNLLPLVDCLILQSQDLKGELVATLHGDLHLKNFIVGPEGVALIDMDNLTKGNPLIDIGSFIAFICYRGILKEVPRQIIEKIIVTFVEKYEKEVPWQVSKPALNWYIAVFLINERAFHCLTRLKPGRLEILNDLIKLASQFSTGSKDSMSF